MSIRISDHTVSFGDNHHLEHFMREDQNLHMAKSFLQQSRDNGRAYVTTPDGNQYLLKYDKASGSHSASWVGKKTA